MKSRGTHPRYKDMAPTREPSASLCSLLKGSLLNTHKTESSTSSGVKDSELAAEEKKSKGLK